MEDFLDLDRPLEVVLELFFELFLEFRFSKKGEEVERGERRLSTTTASRKKASGGSIECLFREKKARNSTQATPNY